MAWIPHITVAAIAERDGKFLLVEELVEDKPVYNQPAGHLEENENLHSAVIRETLEETLMQFIPEHLLGVYHWQQANSRETYIRVAFTGRIEGEARSGKLSKGILNTHWFSCDEVRALPSDKLRNAMVLRCIEDHLAGVRLPLSALPYLNERR